MTDELFFAWLDGELDAEQAAAVEARVASDPALAERARAHRALGAGLRAAFDPVATPAPARIGGEGVGLTPPRAAANENRRLPMWTALAATLALGLAVGTLLPGRGTPEAPVKLDGGRMVAAAALDQALDTQLASAGSGEDVRIGLTFRNADGQWCRSFDGKAGNGLACRRDDDWQVLALFPAGEANGDYRMAAGTDPQLAAIIDGRMAEDAVDPAAERAARDGGWR